MNNRINQQSGLDAIDKLKKAGAPCRFIYLTSSMRPSELGQALALGIEGLVLKEALPEDLIHAVKMIHRGRKYYDVELLESRLAEKRQEDSHKLTPKEMEVLQMFSQGLSNKEIATRLVVTDYTVKKHVSPDPVQAGSDGQNQSGSLLSSAGHVREHGLIMWKARNLRIKQRESLINLVVSSAPSEGRQSSPEGVPVQSCIHSAPHAPLAMPFPKPRKAG